MLKYRLLILSVIFSLLVTGCDRISEQVVGKVLNVIETNQPQVVITKELVVKTVEQVIVTSTPAPTLTPTPVPSFMGTLVQPDPAMQRAVAVSLVALSTDFKIRLFTRAPNGELIVWVSDQRYPDTLWCGAPLYFPGLGSLLVLTSNHFYTTINQFQTFPSATGCVAISLNNGKAQVQKLLEYYQGLYSALRANNRYSSADGVYYDVQEFLKKQKNSPYPYELNMVFVPLVGSDWQNSSIDLRKPATPSGIWDFSFTGVDITYENSPNHVPLASARYWNNVVKELSLLSERINDTMTPTPASGVKIQPLSPQEVLTIWFYQEYWEWLVYHGAFVSGLGTLFRNMDTTIRHNNPSFTPLLPFTGVSHQYDVILAQYWSALGSFIDGKIKDVPTAVLETYIQYARTAIKNTYFDFIVIEEK